MFGIRLIDQPIDGKGMSKVNWESASEAGSKGRGLRAEIWPH
jgi:hypothetical protein